MALSGELVKFVGGELAKNAGKGAAVSALSSLAPKAITSAVTSTLPKAVTKSVLSSIVPKATEAPITLYRGLTQKYDPNYPAAKLDTSGYESWTDNPELARQYGDYVYSIDVPRADIKTSYLDENPASPTYGDRNPIYSIDKKAGLNGVSGNEYLLEVGSDYQKGLKYNPVPSDNDMVTLYHNTKAENIPSIMEQGLVPGKRLEGYMASPEEAGIWTDDGGLTSGSYGGTTVKIRVPRKEFDATRVNDTQNLLNRTISPSEIEGVDYMLYDNPLIKNSNLQEFVDRYGENKVRDLISRKGLVSPEVIDESFRGLSSLGSELSGMNANEINDFTQAAIRANVNPEVATRAMEFLPRNKAVENPGVIMENGKPMKLYHSTPAEFDKFDDSYIGKNTMYDSAKFGHFATPDYDFSSRFADIDNTGKPGYTMEVQIQSKKPITHPYGAGLKYGPVDVDNIVRAYYHELGLDDAIDELAETAAENGTSLYDEYMNLTFGGENPFEVAETERQALMDKGYDSLELVEGRKRDLVEGSQDASPVSSYVAFEGKNINKVKHLPVSQKDSRADIAVNRGEIAQQIAADPDFKRLRQSPARDMLGQEQLDAYKRALNGEVLDDDFLKNDSFAQTLDQESNSRPYLITEDQEKGRAPIPEQQLQEFRDISRKFIDSNLKGVEKNRKAVIVLGRPSSGKSSGAVNAYSSKKGKGFFELDNDEIKKLLPGYDDGMGANAVHPASSYISNNMVLPELANEGYNIVLPIVGKKEAAVEKYLNALYDRGYEISMINTNLPLDKCRTRNRTRAYETGRNVADGYLVSVGENPDLVYNKYKENILNGTERRINGFAEVSTDVPFGSKARVIENSGSELLARLGLGPNKK